MAIHISGLTVDILISRETVTSDLWVLLDSLYLFSFFDMAKGSVQPVLYTRRSSRKHGYLGQIIGYFGEKSWGLRGAVITRKRAFLSLGILAFHGVIENICL